MFVQSNLGRRNTPTASLRSCHATLLLLHRGCLRPGGRCAGAGEERPRPGGDGGQPARRRRRQPSLARRRRCRVLVGTDLSGREGHVASASRGGRAHGHQDEQEPPGAVPRKPIPPGCAVSFREVGNPKESKRLNGQYLKRSRSKYDAAVLNIAPGGPLSLFRFFGVRASGFHAGGHDALPGSQLPGTDRQVFQSDVAGGRTGFRPCCSSREAELSDSSG